MELDEIQTKCLDSQGYIIFAGYITDKTDEKGNHIIEFQYRRHHYSFLDAKEAQRQLGVAIAKDMMEHSNEVDAGGPVEVSDN